MFPLKTWAKNYDEIYIFGDSLSDTGNVFNATQGAIPPDPYYQGRFSNGPVWVEYLANDLGLTPNQTTNFAFGGATTGFDNIGLATLPGLQQEINSFTTSHKSADPNALYILWAGTNDYLDYFFGGIPNPTQTVANLSGVVKALADVGAKDIMVVNLPDLGKFPVTGGNSQISDVLSTLTSEHDSSLSATLKSLSQQLNPDVDIIPVDVNSLFNSIITDPAEFGLADVTDSCIGALSVVPINVPTKSVTCLPNQFLFWDSVHPTTTIHKLIGNLAFSLLQPNSVPEPSAVFGVLVYGALGVMLLLKRKQIA